MERIQYAVAWLFVKMLGVLPRGVARGLAAGTVRLLLLLLPKMRKTAEINLRLAFPEWSHEQRRSLIRGWPGIWDGWRRSLRGCGVIRARILRIWWCWTGTKIFCKEKAAGKA